MADKSKILELDIDIQSIIAKSVTLKTSLDGMRSDMDKLKKSGDTSSENFVKLQASIAKTSTEYNANQKQLQNLATANSSFLTIQDKLTIGLEKEISSISGARTSNAELLKIRNELNLKTADGAKAADLINKKLDENNAFIKENVSGYEKQKINIGNYTESIKDAISQSGLFGGETQKVTQVFNNFSPIFNTLNQDIKNTWAQMNVFGKASSDAAESASDLGGETKLLGQSAEGATIAQKGLAIATNIGTGAMRIFALALAATGITLIIGAVALLIGYFRTFDPVVDAVEQGMAALGAAVRVVQQALAGVLSLDFSGFTGLGDKMASAAKDAAKLKAEMQDLADAQAVQSSANKKQEAEIDRLMLQSKDRGKTEAERIALLDKAEKLNQQNFKANAALADKEYAQAIENARIKGALSQEEIANLQKVGLAYAYKLLNAGKITQEEVDMLAKAEDAKVEIFNRSTAEQEKIINRTNALKEKEDAAREKAQADAAAAAKKSEDLRKKSLEDAINGMKIELDLYIQNNKDISQSLAERLEIAKSVKDQQLAIAQAEFNASKKNKLDELTLLKSQNDAKQAYADAQLEAVSQYSKAEFDLFVASNRSKLEGAKVLTEDLINEESLRIDKLRLEKINQLEIEKKTNQEVVDAKRKANEQLSVADLEYLAQKSDIELEAQKTLQANKDAYDAQLKQQRLDQIALDAELAMADAQTKADEAKIQEQQQYDENFAKLLERKDNELLTEDQYKTLLDDLNEKHAANQKAIDRAVTENRINVLSGSLDTAKGLFKESTVAYKAIAIAQTTMTTYSAAMKAYEDGLSIGGPVGLVLGPVMAGVAVAAGLKNIATIAGVKFEKGVALPTISDGVVKGPSHANGGIDFAVKGKPGFNMEGDEIILTKGVYRNPYLRSLASQLNVAAGGVAFAMGGVPHPSGSVSTLATTINNSQSVIDYDMMASKMAEANKSLPAGRIAIEDINSGQRGYAEVVDGASF